MMEEQMAYTLEQLSADIRETLKADSGITGKQLVCKLVSKALLDQACASYFAVALPN